jgi:hypothetical protein
MASAAAAISATSRLFARALTVKASQVPARTQPAMHSCVGPCLSVIIDVAHALSMAALIFGLPLLFVARWPQATRVYAIYALTFVVLSQTSQWLLGECFLTSLARSALGRGSVSHEWFTVRLARAVFGLAPSERAVSVTFDVIVAVIALGVIVARRRSASPAWWLHQKSQR